MEICALAPHRPCGFVLQPSDISGSASAGPTGSPCLPLLAQSRKSEMKQYSISEACYAALKQPLPVNMAQAMRAVLFARAIAAMLT